MIMQRTGSHFLCMVIFLYLFHKTHNFLHFKRYYYKITICVSVDEQEMEYS